MRALFREKLAGSLGAEAAFQLASHPFVSAAAREADKRHGIVVVRPPKLTLEQGLVFREGVE